MTNASAELQALLDEYKEEEERANRGNNSAATRARKLLTRIKTVCGLARVDLQNGKKPKKSAATRTAA